MGPLFGFPITSVGCERNKISCAGEMKPRNKLKKKLEEKNGGSKNDKKDYLAEFTLLVYGKNGGSQKN